MKKRDISKFNYEYLICPGGFLLHADDLFEELCIFIYINGHIG